MASKLILLDIDGTLATSQKQISPNTKAALLNVQEHGVKLALCSGRPNRGLHPWAEKLRMTEYGGLSSAMDEVKRLADEVTASNDEDGIAHSLFKRLPELF